MNFRSSVKLFGLMVLALAGVLGIVLVQPGGAKADPASPKDHVPPGSYVNPLRIVVSGTGALVESWADPAIISGTDGYFYAYATTDPLNEADRNVGGDLNFHKVPMARSTDLVHWTYIGDAFTTNPDYAAPGAGLWAPDIRYFDGQYYMFYAVTDVNDATSGEPGCPFDRAIGVATSPDPDGPWTHSAQPVVYPRRGGGGCNFFDTIDPAFLEDQKGTRYIYFGSYYGGIWARELLTDSIQTNQEGETQVAIPNRYEGAYLIYRNGFYYLFASATDCCRGPLTGYTVFAGRSESPLGPFLDEFGHSMDEDVSGARAGGHLVISMNGNRWVGPGHNAVISDAAGQDWFVYHAIDRGDPYFADPNPHNVNKRPMLMDRLDWYNGWPTVRAGYWASDDPQPGPILITGTVPPPTPEMRPNDEGDALLEPYTDEFSGTLEPQWGWVREPPTTTYSLTERPGYFRFRTQQADLHQASNNASVLTQTAPLGEFLVETKFEFNLDPSGCCFNFQQAGIVLYQDDDHYVKLAHVSIWETRQTEWAKETGENDPDRARTATYGNSVIGPPGAAGVQTTTTWLRIVRRLDANTGEQYYTGYSSIDGKNWVRGATWTHDLSDIKIGLFAMGRGGPASDPNDVRTADFDYVRVYSLAPLEPTATATAENTATSTATETGTSTSTAMPSSTSTATGTSTRTATTVPSSTSTSTSTSTAVATAVTTATATACPIEFADVQPGDTFYSFIRCLACRGIVGGYPCGGPGEQCNANQEPYYRPGASVTRGQLSKIVAISAGLNDPIAPGQQQFADVQPGSPFYEYVERLAMTGAIAGYPCSGPGEGCDEEERPFFRPNNPATRGQISKIVSIAAGFEEDIPANRQSFRDVPTDSPFWVYIERLAGRGIISGYGEASRCPETGPPCFRYNDQTSRGQMAKIAANAFFPNCQTPARR